MVGYKHVMTWSPSERKVRLFRLVFRGLHRGIGGNWLGKAFLSVSLVPHLLRCRRGEQGWELVICGLRLHYKRSYGGWLS
jgi:hypothetical protein